MSVSRRPYFLFLTLALIAVIGALIVRTRVEGATASDVLNVYLGPSDLQLDPHLMETSLSMTIVMQLHRGLLRFDANGDCVPDLAQSWEASKDHKTYRFKLREAYFSNGKRISSQHVLFSFARVFALDAGIAADIEYIAGADKFRRTRKIEDLGIKTIGDDAIEFHLAAPSAIFLKHLAVADLAVMPFESMNGIERAPKAYSGPYRPLTEIPEGKFSQEVLELIKWRDDHLQSARPPQRIRFLNGTENPIEMAMSGDNDSLDSLAIPSDVRERLEAKGWAATPTEITKERFIILNADKLSYELRRYLASRIDQNEIVRRLEESNFKPAYGLIPDGFPGALLKSDVPDQGKRFEYNGPKVRIQFDFNEGGELDATIANYVKEAWSHERIEVVLSPLAPRVRLSRLLAKQSDTALGMKGIDYPDGYSVLTYFKGGYDANFFFVNDPKIDTKISRSVLEFDSMKRTEFYRDVQRDVLKLKTVVPLFFGSNASGFWSSKVKNAPSHPMGLHTMSFETIELQDE